MNNNNSNTNTTTKQLHSNNHNHKKTNPARVVRTIRRAIMVAREVGHSYVQAYTSCNIEYSIPTPDVIQDAFDVEKDRYGFEEYVSPAAKEYLQDMGEKIKEKK